MSTELKPGDPVSFTDYYGVTGDQGTYVGLYHDTANGICNNVMVIQFVSYDQSTRYAGCVAIPHVWKGYDGKPDGFGAYLVAHYYGDSIETLVHCAREQKPRKWEKR